MLFALTAWRILMTLEIAETLGFKAKKMHYVLYIRIPYVESLTKEQDIMHLHWDLSFSSLTKPSAGARNVIFGLLASAPPALA